MTDMGIEGQKCTQPVERILLDKLQKARSIKFEKVERRSDRPFDLSVKGTDERGVNFSAWLMLQAINELVPWTTRDVAAMTDYPQMARAGDWSGVRDTDNDKLWAIFNKYVLPDLYPEPILFPQDKERLRQAVNLIAHVRNDVAAMDHPDNLPAGIKEGLQKLKEAEALFNRVGAKCKLYGVDLPFPCETPANRK